MERGVSPRHDHTPTIMLNDQSALEAVVKQAILDGPIVCLDRVIRLSKGPAFRRSPNTKQNKPQNLHPSRAPLHQRETAHLLPGLH